MLRKTIPIKAEEGDYGCCPDCAWRGTDACDECEDADHYEFDDSLIEEEEDSLMAA